MNRDDILAFLEANKALIQRDYGVERIGLFGSYARRMEGAESDVDIMVEFDSAHKTLRNYFGFKRYLESHFGREVDLGIEGAIKPAVRESIGKQVIYVWAQAGPLSERHIDSARAIRSYVEGVDFDGFVSDRMRCSAVIREFEIIGEAVGKLPGSLKARYPEVPWREIKDFRNLLIHEYFGVDLPIV